MREPLREPLRDRTNLVVGREQIKAAANKIKLQESVLRKQAERAAENEEQLTKVRSSVAPAGRAFREIRPEVTQRSPREAAAGGTAEVWRPGGLSAQARGLAAVTEFWRPGAPDAGGQVAQQPQRSPVLSNRGVAVSFAGTARRAASPEELRPAVRSLPTVVAAQPVVEDKAEEEEEQYVQPVVPEFDAASLTNWRLDETTSALLAMKATDAAQCRLERIVHIEVPEGVGADRKVRVQLHNMIVELRIPEGAKVGVVVPCDVPRNAPMKAEFQEDLLHDVMHCRLRWTYLDDGRVTCDDGPNGRFQYKMDIFRGMRGRCMGAVLPRLVEDETEEAAS